MKPDIFIRLFYMMNRNLESFDDEDLGCIYIVRNPRAKKIIARRNADGVFLTVPSLCSQKHILSSFSSLKPRIMELKIKKRISFAPSIQFQTLTFSVQIQNNNVQNFYTQLRNNVLTIVCPNISNFLDEKIQCTIRNTIENAMRSEAQKILPQKLEELAKLNGFTFSGISINKSRGRWGSCSSAKKINLSYFCMLLPQHLVDFVILHELCHTEQMNHGSDFWTLLDSVTHNQARTLTMELNMFESFW